MLVYRSRDVCAEESGHAVNMGENFEGVQPTECRPTVLERIGARVVEVADQPPFSTESMSDLRLNHTRSSSDRAA